MAELEDGVSQAEREVRALVGVAGALAGLHEVPLLDPGSEPVELPPLDESIATLSTARHLLDPVRLELLSRLNAANRQQSLGLDLDGFADSFVREDLRGYPAGDEVRRTLLSRLDNWVEGTEPLGRANLADVLAETNAAGLLDSIKCTALTLRPACGTASVPVQGHLALSIVTDMTTTCTEFAAFKNLVNPLQWPSCPLQGQFFQSMKAQPGKKTAPSPDVGGWKQPIDETCNFGFILPGSTSQLLQTRLDFLFFWNPPTAAPGGGAGTPASVSLAPSPASAGAGITGVVTPSTTGCGGCTYDLVASVGNQVLVDQGYLLVEQLPSQLPNTTHCRYRTQKEVCFAFGNPPAGDVCWFWSFILATIVQGCT